MKRFFQIPFFYKKYHLIFKSFFLLLACSNYTLSQSNLLHVLDTVISKSKEISLYSDSVDWPSLRNIMIDAVDNPKEIDDLKPAFDILLNKLGDHHGSIKKTIDYSSISYFTDHEKMRKKDNREFNPDVWGVVNDIELKFDYALLPSKIGYLKVVGVGPNIDGQKEVERIRTAIQYLSKESVQKWIIDLRYNGGGNINVMLGGLAPLLDFQEIASIQDTDGNIHFNAEIKNGNFYYAGTNVFPVKETVQINNPQIAILTSRWTVSSGELVAVAFKGQKNTKFIGEATGGYTTNNSWEIINDEIILVISTGYYADRNGNIYTENVKPDLEIEFEIASTFSGDKGINTAIKWLNSK